MSTAVVAPSGDPDEVLTLRQAAALLGVDYYTARRWAEDKTLRSTKIRSRYFIRRRWVDQLIDEGEPAA